jgi:hypothetical protein
MSAAQTFALTAALAKLEDSGGAYTRFQCADDSNFHVILGASQGVTVPQRYLVKSGGGKLATSSLYHGAAQTTCTTSAFNFHQVPFFNNVYDTSLQAASASGGSCTPGANYFGTGWSSYLGTVFPGVPPEVAQSTTNTAVSTPVLTIDGPLGSRCTCNY